MTHSRLFRTMLGLPGRASVRVLSNIAGLLLVVLLTASGAYAQGAAAPGDAAWDRLGCWNCHGSNGYTNMSRAGRPSIAKTPLPFSRFAGQVRLPARQMPPHPRALAADVDLAIAYHWLGGSDAVAAPPPITLELESSPEGKADAQAEARVAIDMTAVRAQTALDLDVRDLTALNYRVTLITNSNPGKANRTLEYQQAGPGDWSKVTLNADGEALLGPDRRFVATNATDSGKARARLRMAIPTARMVMVIEALDYVQPAKPVIVGIGTVILKAPGEPSGTDDRDNR
jgi:hypothetical protein